MYLYITEKYVKKNKQNRWPFNTITSKKYKLQYKTCF